jgi:hypothetical protein
MKEIAQTNCYKIGIDKTKNRLYLKVIGFWNDFSLVSNYPDDIKKAGQELTPGFTVLADLTEMEPMPKEVGHLHEQAQKILVVLGLRKTAEILPSSTILKMQVNKYAKSSEMPKAEFRSIEEAEAWLDIE